MVSVDLKTYCNNCPHFEPVSSKVYSDNRSLYTIIECENRRKCDRIEAYLKRKMEKEDHVSYEN